MHRSGTSAVCDALDVPGVNFGQRLAPATKDNEKRYWEHSEIVALHRTFASEDVTFKLPEYE